MVQTFKKILNYTAVGSSIKLDQLIIDPTLANALGQTGVQDGIVPVGSHVNGVLVLGGMGNVGATAIECIATLQFLETGQSTVDPLAMGTSSQRSQIIKTWHMLIAPNEHRAFGGYVRLPKMMRRGKENRRLYLVCNSNASRTQASVIIYKVRN